MIPAAIADYIARDNAGQEVGPCFTPETEVLDEGETHRGRKEIEAWKRAARAKYAHRAEVTGMEMEGARHVATCHVTGDFPGGEVALRYTFTLDGGRIARLEIAP